jgi:signal transduction histidine kinase
LNRLKTEFLGNVSHELKTPLAVMLSVAQNAGRELEKRDKGDPLASDMKILSSENERLGLMVTQILDATRIEENSMIWNMRECEIGEIIQTTKATYYPLLKKNGNRLVIQPSLDMPPVYADPDRVSQVLVNLLQNAIRHTQGGTITIGARTVTHDSESGEREMVEVSVADTGEGIEPERLPHIFERFVSRDSGKKARSRRDTGTGLGLYICKHIAESQGGAIAIESEPGKGTTVRFTIPVHQGVE